MKHDTVYTAFKPKREGKRHRLEIVQNFQRVNEAARDADYE
jgi:hypothetical protein